MVDVWNEAFHRCLLEDEGQEGREKLLVACVKETLAQLRVWLRNRPVREVAVSTCGPRWAHSIFGDVQAWSGTKVRVPGTADAES